MTLSILIPCYNEGATIRQVVERVLSIPIDKQVIVIDDGSDDETAKLLKDMKEQGITVLRHDRNQGKGTAIRTGLAVATGEVVVIQDGDLEYDPNDLVNMVEYRVRHRAPIVYGSRVLGNAPWSGTGYYLGGRFLSFLTNLLYGSNITDEPTCYKMFDRVVLDQIQLTCKRFEFCPEVTAKALRLGYPIHEIAINYSPRNRQEGKKIRFRDGLEAIWTLLKFRIVPLSTFLRQRGEE